MRLIKAAVIAASFSLFACSGGESGQPPGQPQQAPADEAQARALAEQFAVAYLSTLVAFELSLMPVALLNDSRVRLQQTNCSDDEQLSGYTTLRDAGGVDLVDCELSLVYRPNEAISAGRVTGNYSVVSRSAPDASGVISLRQAKFSVVRVPSGAEWPDIGPYVASGGLDASIDESPVSPMLSYVSAGSTGGPGQPSRDTITVQFPGRSIDFFFTTPNQPLGCLINIGAINGAENMAFSCSDISASGVRFSSSVRDISDGQSVGLIRVFSGADRNFDTAVSFSFEAGKVDVEAFEIGGVTATLNFNEPPLSDVLDSYR